MMQRSNSLMIISIISGLIIITLVFLGWVSLSQKSAMVYHINSYGPSGFKALAQLLEQEGFRIQAKDKPQFGKQVLLISPGRELTTAVQEDIFNRVKQGGIVMEISAGPQLAGSMEKLIPVWPQEAQKVLPTPEWLQGLDYLPGKSALKGLKSPSHGFYEVNGAYIIYGQEYGRGMLLHWNDPDGLTNSFIKKNPDNAVIFTLILKSFAKTNQIVMLRTNRPIAQNSVDTPLQLFLKKYLTMIILLLVILGLAIWKWAARFGRPQPLNLGKGRSADEFVYSMASLFQKANTRELVVENLWGSLKQVISQITTMPPQTDLDTLLDRLETVTGRDHKLIKMLAVQVNQGGYRHSKPQFMELILKIDNTRRELWEWKNRSV